MFKKLSYNFKKRVRLGDHFRQDSRSIQMRDEDDDNNDDINSQSASSSSGSPQRQQSQSSSSSTPLSPKSQLNLLKIANSAAKTTSQSLRRSPPSAQQNALNNHMNSSSKKQQQQQQLQKNLKYHNQGSSASKHVHNSSNPVSAGATSEVSYLFCNQPNHEMNQLNMVCLHANCPKKGLICCMCLDEHAIHLSDCLAFQKVVSQLKSPSTTFADIRSASNNTSNSIISTHAHSISTTSKRLQQEYDEIVSIIHDFTVFIHGFLDDLTQHFVSLKQDIASKWEDELEQQTRYMQQQVADIRARKAPESQLKQFLEMIEIGQIISDSMHHQSSETLQQSINSFLQNVQLTAASSQNQSHLHLIVDSTNSSEELALHQQLQHSYQHQQSSQSRQLADSMSSVNSQKAYLQALFSKYTQHLTTAASLVQSPDMSCEIVQLNTSGSNTSESAEESEQELEFELEQEHDPSDEQIEQQQYHELQYDNKNTRSSSSSNNNNNILTQNVVSTRNINPAAPALTYNPEIKINTQNKSSMIPQKQEMMIVQSQDSKCKNEENEDESQNENIENAGEVEAVDVETVQEVAEVEEVEAEEAVQEEALEAEDINNSQKKNSQEIQNEVNENILSQSSEENNQQEEVQEPQQPEPEVELNNEIPSVYQQSTQQQKPQIETIEIEEDEVESESEVQQSNVINQNQIQQEVVEKSVELEQVEENSTIEQHQKTQSNLIQLQQVSLNSPQPQQQQSNQQSQQVPKQSTQVVVEHRLNSLVRDTFLKQRKNKKQTLQQTREFDQGPELKKRMKTEKDGLDPSTRAAIALIMQDIHSSDEEDSVVAPLQAAATTVAVDSAVATTATVVEECHAQIPIQNSSQLKPVVAEVELNCNNVSSSSESDSDDDLDILSQISRSNRIFNHDVSGQSSRTFETLAPAVNVNASLITANPPLMEQPTQFNITTVEKVSQISGNEISINETNNINNTNISKSVAIPIIGTQQKESFQVEQPIVIELDQTISEDEITILSQDCQQELHSQVQQEEQQEVVQEEQAAVEEQEEVQVVEEQEEVQVVEEQEVEQEQEEQDQLEEEEEEVEQLSQSRCDEAEEVEQQQQQQEEEEEQNCEEQIHTFGAYEQNEMNNNEVAAPEEESEPFFDNQMFSSPFSKPQPKQSQQQHESIFSFQQQSQQQAEQQSVRRGREMPKWHKHLMQLEESQDNEYEGEDQLIPINSNAENEDEEGSPVEIMTFQQPMSQFQIATSSNNNNNQNSNNNSSPVRFFYPDEYSFQDSRVTSPSFTDKTIVNNDQEILQNNNHPHRNLFTQINSSQKKERTNILTMLAQDDIYDFNSRSESPSPQSKISKKMLRRKVREEAGQNYTKKSATSVEEDDEEGDSNTSPSMRFGRPKSRKMRRTPTNIIQQSQQAYDLEVKIEYYDEVTRSYQIY